MNIIFVSSVNSLASKLKPLDTPLQMQFGISYISSLLKKQGHKTKLIVLSGLLGRRNPDLIDKKIKEFPPGLICFTAVCSEYPFIARLAKYIKDRYPGIFLLIGGPHVSLNPSEVLVDGFDALCVGEGEYPVVELASQLEKNKLPSSIQNLWIKHGRDIEKNTQRPFLHDLDSLPFPDREMWQEWIEQRQPSQNSKHAVLLGRGCPFQCTYCCNHALQKLAEGEYVRLRSPDNILGEIKEIVEYFPAQNSIYLEAENFGIDKAWALELCSKLERFNRSLNHPLSFATNLRITPHAELESLFAACKRSNFGYIKIGLESGSERVRSQILKRNYSNQDIINAVALARKYGIKIALYNMIGIPGETAEDFKETVRINRACLPDYNCLSIFFPYPGTDLYRLCKEKGLLKKPLDTEMERTKATLDLPGFSRKQIQKGYTWFDYHVYKGHKPRLKLLARIPIIKLQSRAYLQSFFKMVLHMPFLRWLRDASKY